MEKKEDRNEISELVWAKETSYKVLRNLNFQLVF